MGTRINGADLTQIKGSTAAQFVAITPDDSETFEPTGGLILGTGGTIYVDGADVGTNVKLVLPAGVHWGLSVTRIYASGLANAADIVALYAAD